MTTDLVRRAIPLLAILLVSAFQVSLQTGAGDRVNVAGMALIPGATFEMGQDAGEIPKLMKKFGVSRAELFQEETPRHRVTIGSFYIDRTEVTNAQFKSFVDKNAAWQKDKVATSFHNGKYLQHWNGNEYPAGTGDRPVNFVTWQAAAAYCSSLGKRLPREAEWEYAARGGLEGKAFPWGDEMPDKTRANYGASEIEGPTRVGSYLANGYGLHDMAGNVWEFLADEWQKYPLDSGTDPTSLFKDRSFLAVKTRRALRGGSFDGGAVNLRVTYRDSHMPDNAVEHVGFRCAMTSPQQSEAVNELLRIHYADRASHFGRDAASLVARFSDDHTNISDGRVSQPRHEVFRRQMQAYFDASTFLEWDDIAPPVIHISDDASMAHVIVQKKVRLRARNAAGVEEERADVFAWLSTYRKIGGQWKLTTITSTNTPEDDK
ncbi:MAG: formylglycine-generating enzyme family protein [Chloracidobacterium sp.]|nr:formylglycine-generating enzyme family protein [Chloracidobacterium sp.]